jgi:SlyX protein
MGPRAMTETERRLVELELRYTEQQDYIEKLSDVLIEQQKVLDRLQSEVSLLRKRFEVEPGVTEAGAVERPPHY